MEEDGGDLERGEGGGNSILAGKAGVDWAMALFIAFSTLLQPNIFLKFSSSSLPLINEAGRTSWGGGVADFDPLFTAAVHSLGTLGALSDFSAPTASFGIVAGCDGFFLVYALDKCLMAQQCGWRPSTITKMFWP